MSFNNFWEGQAQTSEIATLQNFVNAYDATTHAHVQRTTYLARKVAKHLHFSQEEIYQTCLAALLHDIGKILIPSAILHKAGPLTAEEWKVMRQHPELGQSLLLQAGGVFVHIQHSVLAHHERWDGSGYPRNLVGEEIPFFARILAVVDSYDAMISSRAYHGPFSQVMACEELRSCAGSKYDPRVVAALLEVLDVPDLSMVLFSS
jgi:HD-GYP domain-containing protein (c-di-GMP phosphodiesterase class II)